MCVPTSRVYVTFIGQSNIHSTSGAHKHNNGNNIMPMFIGLNKTTQKTRMPKEENREGKDKELCS
jgi:hypothetical protein